MNQCLKVNHDQILIFYKLYINFAQTELLFNLTNIKIKLFQSNIKRILSFIFNKTKSG